MGIGALCAAAAVVVGVGSAAEAATIVDYDIWLRFEGTEYHGVMYYDPMVEESGGEVDIPIGGDWLGIIPLHHSDLTAGQIVKFTASILFPDNPYFEAASAEGCMLAGATTCADGRQAIQRSNGEFVLWNDMREWILTGSANIGEQFTFQEFSLRRDSRLTADGKYSYYTEFETSVFTVVPAPVPLPATAALLPLGLGALAMMRRRRRLFN